MNFLQNKQYHQPREAQSSASSYPPNPVYTVICCVFLMPKHNAVQSTESSFLIRTLPLCDPMDCSPPGSSVHGILQARLLEWVAISFSKKWKWKSLSRARLWDPMDYPVHGILQARILEWAAVPYSKGSSPTQGSSPGLPHCRRFFTSWATGEALLGSTWRLKLTSAKCLLLDLAHN